MAQPLLNRVHSVARPFDPEYFFIPEEWSLADARELLRRAQIAMDHLRAGRGEALSLASRFEKRAQDAEQRARAARSIEIQAHEKGRDLERRLHAVTDERDRLRARFEDAKKIAEQSVALQIQILQERVSALSREATELREQLTEILAGDAGEDCEECLGSGLVEDEDLVGDPGAWDGHTVRSVSVPCESCFSGRVAR